MLGFDQVYEAITRTAIDVGFDAYSGYGLVDAYTAVEYALNIP
ncbi:MAG: hypothetical protein ABWW69_06195 [Pyrodictiaceae archaeon]